MAVELGAAYVTVIPEMAGAQRAIGQALGDNSLGNAAGMALGGGFSDGFAGTLKNLAKLVAGSAVAKALFDLGRSAFDAYAEFEQLEGGVQTLFGDAADTVMANAQAAYETAGMSANQYMEQATSTSAALIQSLDGDTQRAAELTDQAIRDMSDNANKMGTDLDRITDAYQGFSRGNFTMLDNLKLGYGGTREEMERLLADAEAISGVHYDIDSYADITEAIHVIQDSMGIAGTTAQEAADTISGSIGMAQAAWQNWLVGLADDDADMEALTGQLVDSIVTAARNIIPRIAEIVTSFVAEIPNVAMEIATSFAEAFLPAIDEATGGAASGVIGFVTETVGAAREAFGDFVAAIQPAIDVVSSFATGKGGKFASMMHSVMDSLRNAAPEFDRLKENVRGLVDSIGNFLAPVINAVAPVIVDFVSEVARRAAEMAPIVLKALNTVVEVLSAVFDHAGELVSWMTETFGPAFEVAAEWAGDAFGDLVDTIGGVVDGISDVVGGIIDFLDGIFNQDMGSIAEGAGEIWQGLLDILGEVFPGIEGVIQGFADFLGPVAEAIFDAFDAIAEVVGVVGGAIGDFCEWAGEELGIFSDDAGDAASSVSDSLTDGVGEGVRHATGSLDNLSRRATSTLRDVEGRASKSISATRGHISSGMAGAAKDAIAQANTMKTGVQGALASIESAAKSRANGVKAALSGSLSGAYSSIKSDLGKIQGAFSNMRLKIPSVKVPSFSINWKTSTRNNASVSVPDISASYKWLAKGGIVNGASIVGVGEAGPEAILPLDKIEPIIARAMGRAGGGDTYVVSINNARINDTPAIREATKNYLVELMRKGAM